MANSPNEMATFERVAMRGSFAGAAKYVSLSPSAVAKLITRGATPWCTADQSDYTAAGANRRGRKQPHWSPLLPLRRAERQLRGC
jgi:hypothetical protein